MIRRILQISVFPCLSVISAAYCQPNEPNQAIERICERWIDSSGMVKILNIEKIAIADGKPSGRTVNISFKFSNNYEEPVVEWAKIKQGFAGRGIDVEKLLRYKLLALLNVYAVNSIHLIIPYDDVSIKGVEAEADFGYDKLIDQSFSGNYVPVPERKLGGLAGYIKPLKQYFKSYPHKPTDTVGVAVTDELPEQLSFDVSNVFGKVTGKYYEIIHIDIWLKQHPDGSEVFYRLKYVEYGAGYKAPPKVADDYADARKRFFQEEWNYFVQLGSDLERRIK